MLDAFTDEKLVWYLMRGSGMVVLALLTAGEVMASITALEFAYTQAPRHLKAVVQAVFVVAFEQHLQTETDAEERLAGMDVLDDGLSQPRASQCGDRILERADAQLGPLQVEHDRARPLGLGLL